MGTQKFTDALGEAGAVLPAGVLTAPDKLGRQYRLYADEERRALYEVIYRARYGPFGEKESRKGWDEIAEALGVARGTLYAWRQLDDYKEAEQRYQQLLLDEGRSSSAGLVDEAVQRMRYLMHHDRSGYVQLEAAKELYRIASTERARSRDAAAGGQAMIEFQKLIRTRQGRLATLKELGLDEERVLDVEAKEVKPGGRLPDEVVAENELDRERIAREKALAALEAGHPDAEDGGADDGI